MNKRNIKFWLLIALITLTNTGGFGKIDGPGKTEREKIRLEDKKWLLEALNGKQVPVAGASAFIVFDAKKGSAGGNTSCNVFGGSYKAGGESIVITDIILTMRACEEDERMTIEREFLDGLQKATRYEIKRGTLYLFRGRSLLLTLRGTDKR